MDTLEQRVERLERSCRRWRLGFLILAAATVLGAAAKPAPAPDAQFGHLTVQSLTVRDQPGGPFIRAGCDDTQAFIKMDAPASQTFIALNAGKDSANVTVSRDMNRGLNSGSLTADDQSGSIDLHDVAGKDKEVGAE